MIETSNVHNKVHNKEQSNIPATMPDGDSKSYRCPDFILCEALAIVVATLLINYHHFVSSADYDALAA